MIATVLPNSSTKSAWRFRPNVALRGGVEFCDRSVSGHSAKNRSYHHAVLPLVIPRPHKAVSRSTGDKELSFLTAIEPDLTDEIPWSDRRIADRSPVRPGSRIEIRRWG